jgi:hypothetical protein
MNWLGKVFVVVILIMSLVFMGLSMAVYATHKNWKEVSDSLKARLDQTNAEKDKLVTEHNNKVLELDREKTSAVAQVAKLETELQAASTNNLAIQAELDGLKQNQRDHIAAVASTQALNQNLTGEVTKLRTDIKSEQQTRDRLFKQALDATETLHQEAGEYNSARERSEQLTKQVAGMTTVMREKGIDPATEPGSVVPIVEGIVNQVRRTAGAQLIEVSIGADDGLKTGNTVEISRGGKYLGRLEIIETSPDKSVGRVDRRFQQGQIQEGDRVATRIKL